MPAATDEPQVSWTAPMPRGYRFVPKGNVYITANCRRATHAAGAPVYVVVDPKLKGRASIRGIRVPNAIYQVVAAAEEQTREKRAANVRAREDAGARSFSAEVLRLFPHTPATQVARISRHALVKRSRRVGRSGTMDLEQKVRLAVVAHIRHVETDYDALLKPKGRHTRDEARWLVWPRVNEVADKWAGRKDSLGPRSAGSKRKGPTHAKPASDGTSQPRKTGQKRCDPQEKGKRTQQDPAPGTASARRKGAATRARPDTSDAARRNPAPKTRPKGIKRNSAAFESQPRGTQSDPLVVDDDDTLEYEDDTKEDADDSEDEASYTDSDYQSSLLDDGSEEEAQFTEDDEVYDSDMMEIDLGSD